LLRRTRLGMCLANGGAELYPVLEALFKSERQWNSEQWDTEVNRYKAIWQNYYSLPQTS
jgi:glycerol-3-phosphate dehydrogenase